MSATASGTAGSPVPVTASAATGVSSNGSSVPAAAPPSVSSGAASAGDVRPSATPGCPQTVTGASAAVLESAHVVAGAVRLSHRRTRQSRRARAHRSFSRDGSTATSRSATVRRGLSMPGDGHGALARLGGCCGPAVRRTQGGSLRRDRDAADGQLGRHVAGLLSVPKAGRWAAVDRDRAGVRGRGLWRRRRASWRRPSAGRCGGQVVALRSRRLWLTSAVRARSRRTRQTAGSLRPACRRRS